MVSAYPTPSRRTGCLDQLSCWRLSSPPFQRFPIPRPSSKGRGGAFCSVPLSGIDVCSAFPCDGPLSRKNRPTFQIWLATCLIWQVHNSPYPTNPPRCPHGHRPLPAPSCSIHARTCLLLAPSFIRRQRRAEWTSTSISWTIPFTQLKPLSVSL